MTRDIKTIAVMQPYFLPYLGYWQLLAAANCFVVFDDVNYINRGWINRNRILVNGSPRYITLPLDHASQNRKICETRLQADDGAWRDRILRTVELAYKKARFFRSEFPLIETIVRHDENDLAAYLTHQLQVISRHLRLPATIVRASRTYDCGDLAGQDRILRICQLEGASRYINAIGGQGLYDERSFGALGIELRFIRMGEIHYPQLAGDFVPHLSILDALMHAGRQEVGRMLQDYALVAPAGAPAEAG